MFKKLFQRVLANQLIKVSLLSGIGNFVRLLTNLISSKVLAVYTGPAGIAMLGQLNNLVLILMPFSTGGINTGIIKYVSEYKDDYKELRKLIGTGITIVLFSSVLVAVFTLLFSSALCQKFFGDQQYRFIFIVLAFTLISYSGNNFIVSIINGFGVYKTLVQVNIYSSIFGLILTLTLSLIWSIKGALLAYILAQGSLFFLVIFMIQKYKWKVFLIPQLTVNKQMAINLFKFSLMALVTALTAPICQLIIRHIIIDNASIEEAGLWDAVNRLSYMSITLMTASLSVYYLPKISGLRTASAIKLEILKSYKIIMPVAGILLFGIYLFRTLIIKVVFTDKFLPVQEFMWIQLIGDFFKIGSLLLYYTIIARAKMKLYIAAEIISLVLYLSLVYAYIYVYGYSLSGVFIAYALSFLVYWLALISLHKKIIN